MQKIMFNDRYGLTEAVLAGRKTQTRRVLGEALLAKIQAFQQAYYEASLDMLEGVELIEAYFANYPEKLPIKVGEVVAVAQPYCAITDDLRVHQCIMLAETPGWKNKMFVDPHLMPYKIRITGVRVERLQAISDLDCVEEGLQFSYNAQSYYVGYHKETGARTWLGKTPREAYAALIDKVSGKGTWAANPYVFVYNYKLIK